MKDTYRWSCRTGTWLKVSGREVRKGSPGELMVESSPSRQRRPPCKTSREMADEAPDAAAFTYLLTYLLPCMPAVAPKSHFCTSMTVIILLLCVYCIYLLGLRIYIEVPWCACNTPNPAPKEQGTGGTQ